MCQPDGEPVEILIRLEGDDSAILKEIISPYGPNSLGTAKARAIFRLLQQAYPGIETLSGYRSTGVRWNKPEELKFSLDRITGTANATRAAT